MTTTPATIHTFYCDINVSQAVADRIGKSPQGIALIWPHSQPPPAIGDLKGLQNPDGDIVVTAIERDVVVRGAGRVDGPSAIVHLVIGEMVLAVWKCPRCGRSSTERFTWAHKPLGSDIRTCGKEPVLEHVTP